MSDPTEDTVNDLMASYLRDHGLPITTQSSARVPHGRRKPDFESRNGGVYYGEGEWFSSYIHGYDQAIEFGDIPGSTGYFLIGYPEELKSNIKQKRLASVRPEDLLSGFNYRGMFKAKGERPRLVLGPLEKIPVWLRRAFQREPPIEEPGEFVNLMRDLVEDLTIFLPVSERYPPLFEHIIGTIPRGVEKLETARRAAAFLLLNQVVFYRILGGRGYPRIDPDDLKKPGDLQRIYFREVLKDDYQAVFDFNVASIFPDRSLHFIRAMVQIVEDLRPEEFTRDLLGNIFHSLIPLEVRKPVAAYYTNPMAARLLARLVLSSAHDSVADLACGSGTLLMAAYDQKAALFGQGFGEEQHRRFIENDLTGVDIMPFAAHLAVVQLALRNPVYWTDRVRVAVHDSTTLRPGSSIVSLQRVMAKGQAKVDHFDAAVVERVKVRQGAVSSAGAGKGFALELVDVCLMNPPFTRKQSISSEYRSELTRAFSAYSDFASKEMNLYGYFVLLADRFLKQGGRLAMVLPAAILQQASTAGIRRLFQERYTLELVLFSESRSAFSEDTSFREILLVARKLGPDAPRETKCVVADLKVMPDEGNIDQIVGAIGARSSKSARSIIDVRELDQERFRTTTDWSAIIRSTGSFSFDYPPSKKLSPLRDVVPEIIQGIRFDSSSDRVNVKNTLLSFPRGVRTRLDWRIIGENEKEVTVRNQQTLAEVKVPRSVLRPATRSASGLDVLQIGKPPDYIVIRRFRGDEQFWDDPNPDVVVAKRGEHVSSREAFVVVAGYGNINLAASGTHLIAFVSKVPIVPTWSLWSVRTRSFEESRLLALWWNSTFSVAKLVSTRTEVEGSTMKWRKESLLEIPVLDEKRLDRGVAESLLDVYDQVCATQFPSLLDQLKNRFPIRVKMDLALAKALGWNEYQDERRLDELYDQLLSYLRGLRSLMGKG